MITCFDLTINKTIISFVFFKIYLKINISNVKQKVFIQINNYWDPVIGQIDQLFEF